MNKGYDSTETYAAGITVSTLAEKTTSTQPYRFINTVILSQTVLAQGGPR